MLIDTHAHIQFDTYDDSRDAVVERALETGVQYIICPGIDLDSSEQAIELADRYDPVYAAAGIHPHDSEDLPANWLQQIEEMSKHPKVVALGEMGLDYFKEYSPRESQKAIFRSQMELACDIDMPIIVHNRDSDDDMRSLITGYGPGSGVLHCFVSDITMATEMVNLGYLISFTGIATFGNATVENTISKLSLQDMMVETDAPFLTPEPHRGKTNEPAYVTHIADRIAELKSLPVEKVRRTTGENACQLFSLPS